jgi:hypothetical protein
MKGLTMIVVRGPWFGSGLDETQFFDWIKQIKCVRKCDGLGYDLHLSIDGVRMKDQELRELLALFHRYRINMKPLAVFASPGRKWFADPEKYWFKRVFGGAEGTQKQPSK